LAIFSDVRPRCADRTALCTRGPFLVPSERSYLEMPAALPLKDPVKVGQLLRRRLRELKRTPRELAEAVQVTEDYMADLVSGRRRPPAPGRSDLYAPMTKFLRLHRNDLPTCARAEREGCTYLQARMRLLEFLDADAASLTPRDCDEFLRPRITTWDIDLDTHAMRIVLR